MRRKRPLLFGAAVAAAALALVPVGSADPGSLAVTGAGWVTYTNSPPGETTTELTVISAHLDRSGEPHGTIVLRSPFGDVRARVTCMLAVGDVAYVGGEIVKGSTYFGGPVTHIAFGIRDNGQGQDPPDLVAGAIFRPRPPEFDPCTFLSAYPPVYAVERGNFVVRGAD